jgi:hypothetical protein
MIDDRIFLSEFCTVFFPTAMLQNSEMHRETGQTPVSTSYVHCAGIRFRPFWPEKPAVRFAQLEGHFPLSGIAQGPEDIPLRRLPARE